MAGSSAAISPNLTISNNSTFSRSTTGTYDSTKEMTLDIEHSIDSGVAGVGVVCIKATPGSAQTFTSSAAAWTILKFGSKTQIGGILMKADNSAFALTDLPVGAIYANCIAFASDGLCACSGDGDPWRLIGVYAAT